MKNFDTPFLVMHGTADVVARADIVEASSSVRIGGRHCSRTKRIMFWHCTCCFASLCCPLPLCQPRAALCAGGRQLLD